MKRFVLDRLHCGLVVLAVSLCLLGRPSAASGAESGRYGGYGHKATGGAGRPTVKVGNFKQLSDALKKGNATILITADIDVPSNAPHECIETTASNITLDGQGHTIYGDAVRGSGRGTGHILKFTGGKNYILKNFRIRNCNAGGNICFYKGAHDIVIDHVSTTGSSNKGIAISNGSHDATITHCLIAGNTRSIFLKYEGTSRITIDHSIIMKFWIRGPLIVDLNEFDVRNNLVQEWGEFGTGLEGKSNGNVMGNIYIWPKDSHGPAHKTDHAISFRRANKPTGKIFIQDNVFKNSSPDCKSTTDKPLNTPAIVPAYTTDMSKLERDLLSSTKGAGCMPRDAADKAYLASKNWKISYGTPYRPAEALRSKSGDKSQPQKTYRKGGTSKNEE